MNKIKKLPHFLCKEEKNSLIFCENGCIIEEKSERKPLIVKGSRQVGKTESIRQFAKKHYESAIEINFVEEPKYKMIIADGYKTQDTV